MATMFPEGNYRTFGYKTTGTNAEVVYTVPTGFVAAFVVWTNVMDDGGSARTYDMTWTDDAASVTYTMEFAKVLAANVANSKECYLALRSADTVSIKGSAAGLHVTLSVLEIAGRKT